MKNLEKFLEQLDELNLDPQEYFVASSGTLAVKGIRDCNDLDLVVTKELFKDLEQKFPETKRDNDYCEIVSYKDIEFLYITKGDPTYSPSEQLQSAEIIHGKRFQNLEMVKFFKKLSGRDKDLVDLELIKHYESQL